MKLASRVGATGIALVLSLFAGRQSLAYFPANCFPDHAKDDFKEAALVVIGRVTAIQRYRVSEKSGTEFFYLATVTVGRTLKGKAKTEDEILFFTGSYEQRVEDDTAPTMLRVANSHPAWTLEYGHVYLLALDLKSGTNGQNIEERRDGKWSSAHLEKRGVWEPRSCHWSVHEVTVHNREAPTNETVDGLPTVTLTPETYVTLYFDRWSKPRPDEPRILLDEFIAAQKDGKFPKVESKAAAPAPEKTSK